MIQRMRNPKITMVRYVPVAKRPTYDIASISETITPIHEISGRYLENENVSGDAVM